jgi:hypothetical protein
MAERSSSGELSMKNHDNVTLAVQHNEGESMHRLELSSVDDTERQHPPAHPNSTMHLQHRGDHQPAIV